MDKNQQISRVRFKPQGSTTALHTEKCSRTASSVNSFLVYCRHKGADLILVYCRYKRADFSFIVDTNQQISRLSVDTNQQISRVSRSMFQATGIHNSLHTEKWPLTASNVNSFLVYCRHKRADLILVYSRYKRANFSCIVDTNQQISRVRFKPQGSTTALHTEKCSRTASSVNSFLVYCRHKRAYLILSYCRYKPADF